MMQIETMMTQLRLQGMVIIPDKLYHLFRGKVYHLF